MMRRKRTNLQLDRESVRVMTPRELRHVAGGIITAEMRCSSSLSPNEHTHCDCNASLFQTVCCSDPVGTDCCG